MRSFGRRRARVLVAGRCRVAIGVRSRAAATRRPRRSATKRRIERDEKVRVLLTNVTDTQRRRPTW